MTTANLPETWTIAPDEHGALRAQRVLVRRDGGNYRARLEFDPARSSRMGGVGAAVARLDAITPAAQQPCSRWVAPMGFDLLSADECPDCALCGHERDQHGYDRREEIGDEGMAWEESCRRAERGF